MSTQVSKSTILVAFVFLLVNILNVCSNEPVYIRYVRRRPSWFPGDLYMEEVVEEFRTVNRPPSFGSSEDVIQQFLETDQKENGNQTQLKREQYSVVNSTNEEAKTAGKLKASITTTIHKPDSVKLRFREIDSLQNAPYKATTEQVPYTIVIPESVEIDYYDTEDGITTTTTEKPTTRSSFSLFELGKATSTPSTTKTSTSSAPVFSWLEINSKTPSTTSTRPTSTASGTPEPVITTTESYSTSSTTANWINQPAFPWLSTNSTITTSTITQPVATPPTTASTTLSTTTTTTTDGSTATEIESLDISSDRDSATDDLYPDIIETYNVQDSAEVMEVNTTTAPSLVKITTESLDNDYVNGEVINSAEMEEVSTAVTPNITTTTTKKGGLFGWLG